MMDYPITTTTILQHCESEYADTMIVSGTARGIPIQLKYSEFAGRVRQLANALIQLGVTKGDRIATLAWNSHHHMELYYAIAGVGAICHTINPRYSIEQISYIVNHAQDRMLFFDASFGGLVDELRTNTAAVKSIENYIVLYTNAADQESDVEYINYESLISAQSTAIDWPQLEENGDAALCYTSGTTGNPKGVLYTHRSTFLHAVFASKRDALDISSVDVVCPIVPMFHVNAWGIPYIAPMTGATLVLPGPDLTAPALFNLFDSHGVTTTAGVPTVLAALLQYMRANKAKPKSLHTVIIGGAAAPLAMIQGFTEEFDIRVLHGWGMTETSPLATINTPKIALIERSSSEELLRHKQKQGRKLFGVEIKIVDDKGQELAKDGVAQGRLLIRGAWVVDSYYGDQRSACDANGWFDTGDISTIDNDGYMQIVDRSKDVIKSGGEWISSVQLENAAAGHPSVAQAAVIGLPHPKWLERPLLIVVPEKSADVDAQAIKEYLSDHIPKWWMPDAVVFTDTLPMGATGKVQKNRLRDQFPSFEALITTSS